jgi:hypothetical protein
MRKVFMRRGDRTLTDLLNTLGQARESVAQRLDDIDTRPLRKQGAKLYGFVRSDLERRHVVPKRRRGPSAGLIASIAGIAAVGLAAIGAGLLAYDRERREEARKRLEDIQSGARQRYAVLSGTVRDRYAQLTSGTTRDEHELGQKVEQAIAQGGRAPEGLETVIEGRTVYLRGAVSDTASVDAAAERAHGVPGVVAVVNLTTSRSNDKHAPVGAKS